MSLRLRLTLLYASLLGGTLLLLGALVYGLVSFVLLSQIDNTLSQQARQIVAYLRINAADQFDARLFSQYRLPDNNLLVQVWNRNPDLKLELPLGSHDPLDAAGLSISSSEFRSAISNDRHLRVLSVPLNSPRGPAGVLQIALSLSLLDATQQTLASVLFSLVIVSTALAGWGGWGITGRALSPLATATEVAAQITRADDLSRRIPYQGTAQDEVGRLIFSFNKTLERLEGLFNSQRRFIADVSHELRTPLTVIKGEVGLIRKFGVVDDESLRSIDSEVDRLTRMVGDLLLLAQAESGKLPMNITSVELDSVLLEVFQQMRMLAGDKVTLKISEIDQITIAADRDRIKQVLLNLVGNAIQYTPQGGQVTLALSKTADQARILIRDTGPGIAAHDLPNIFERFYRGERSRKRTGGAQSSGFGLGLSIAYWIVRAHQGNIDVDSKEGQGTQFLVWLPLEVKPSPDLPKEHPAAVS